MSNFKQYLAKIMEETKKDSLLEQLAKLEHDQWMEWSKDLAAKENISKERKDRWKKLWIPYAELSEKEKEQDRVYARKILKLIKP